MTDYNDELKSAVFFICIILITISVKWKYKVTYWDFKLDINSVQSFLFASDSNNVVKHPDTNSSQRNSLMVFIMNWHIRSYPGKDNSQVKKVKVTGVFIRDDHICKQRDVLCLEQF